MSRNIPSEGVHYDRLTGEHVIIMVLTPEDARGIADALGSGDAGARELCAWAEEAEAADAPIEDGEHHD